MTPPLPTLQVVIVGLLWYESSRSIVVPGNSHPVAPIRPPQWDALSTSPRLPARSPSAYRGRDRVSASPGSNLLTSLSPPIKVFRQSPPEEVARVRRVGPATVYNSQCLKIVRSKFACGTTTGTAALRQLPGQHRQQTSTRIRQDKRGPNREEQGEVDQRSPRRTPQPDQPALVPRPISIKNAK